MYYVCFSLAEEDGAPCFITDLEEFDDDEWPVQCDKVNLVVAYRTTMLNDVPNTQTVQPDTRNRSNKKDLLSFRLD